MDRRLAWALAIVWASIMVIVGFEIRTYLGPTAWLVFLPLSIILSFMVGWLTAPRSK